MSTKSTEYHKQAVLEYLQAAREAIESDCPDVARQAIGLAQIHVEHLGIGRLSVERNEAANP